MAQRGDTTLTPIKGMNLDLAKNLISPQQTTYAKNVITTYNKGVNNTGQNNNAGIITPPQSNFTDFDGVLPDGKNLTNGAHYDRKLNQNFWFNWNSNGDHEIWIFDANLHTFQRVLADPNLPFDLKNRIGGNVDLVLADTSNGIVNSQNVQRLLYWTYANVDPTSTVNQFPCKINIDRALNGEYSTLTFLDTPNQYFRAVMYPPKNRPQITDTLSNPDPAIIQNYVANQMFQFRYIYYYWDGEQSVPSAISTLAYSVIKTRNFIEITLFAGSSMVSKIELLYRIGNIGDWRSYDIVPRETIIANVIYPYDNVNNTWIYKFFNNKGYTIKDQDTANTFQTNHPLRAGTEAFTESNLLMYGDTLEGYDNLTLAEQATPTVTLAYSDYLPLTLTVSGSIPFVFNGSPAPTDYFEIVLFRTQASTGITSQVVVYTVHPSSTNPLAISHAFTDIDAGDIIWLECGGFMFSAGVTVTLIAGGGSILIGTYTNIPQQRSCGTGNFTVNGTLAQTFATNTHVQFENVVTDPCNTWSIVANEDVVPNSRIGLAQLKQTNGQYSFGFTIFDEAGRATWIQSSPDIQNIIIESLQTNGKYQLVTATFNFNGLVFPDGAYYVSISRTKDTVINRSLGMGYLQFAITDVLFYKADGTTGDPTIDVIKKVGFNLTNLINYNTDNYENTTTTYTWTQGDRIQFIRNGDGTWFDFATYGILDFALSTDPAAPSVNFYCDYSSGLMTLVSNAQVEFYTPAQSQTQNSEYFEVSDIIPLTRVAGNNQSTQASVVLNTFDTYPLFWNEPYVDDAVTDAGTTPFEHHSIYATIVPSNGEDIGRVNFINPNARQLWYPARVRYSNAYLPETFINGLSTFEETRKKEYFRQYGKIGKLICWQYNLGVLQEDKHFRSVISRNLVTLADGTTQLVASNQILSDPIIIEGDYGLQDEASVIVVEDKFYFIDTKRAAICESNWVETIDVSMSDEQKGIIGGVKSFAEAKLKYVYGFNQDDDSIFYVINGGYDPKNKMYVTTEFKTHGGRSSDIEDSYINNNFGVVLDSNETLAYKMVDKFFTCFLPFTPEFYSYVDGNPAGLTMISFKNGIPYFHNQDDVTTYNNFFGVDTDQFISFVVNSSYKTEKNWLTMGYDSKSKTSAISGIKYSANSVTTSDFQTSVIPLNSFQWRNGFYFSNFYYNTSLGGKIYNGEQLHGTWVEVGLLRDITKRTLYNELSTISVKFVTQELALVK